MAFKYHCFEHHLFLAKMRVYQPRTCNWRDGELDFFSGPDDVLAGHRPVVQGVGRLAGLTGGPLLVGGGVQKEEPQHVDVPHPVDAGHEAGSVLQGDVLIPLVLALRNLGPGSGLVTNSIHAGF